MSDGAQRGVNVAVAPTVPRRYFGALDGFRALAALGVLVNHVTLLSGFNVRSKAFGPYFARADVGVSIFFLISGFLLYRPFVAAHLEGRPPGNLGRYLKRRALRILPAYWVAITIVAFVLHTPGFEGPHNVAMHYLLIHVYDFPQVTGGPIQQSWSLATEVTFYLFLPLYAWLLGRRATSPERQIRLELLGVAGLWAASTALKVVVLAAGVDADRFGMYSTWLPFRLDEFALGMGLGVLSAWLAHRRIELPVWTRRPSATLACWAMAAVLFWVVSTRLDMPLAPLYTARQAAVLRIFFAFCALFLLLPAVLGPAGRGIVRALFENRLMVFLGLISYGLYIWHEAWQDKYLDWTGEVPFGASVWNMLAVTAGLSIVAASLSWYLVERPALRLKDRRVMPRGTGRRPVPVEPAT